MARIQRIINLVEDNLSEDLNVIRLAEQSQMSPWHFQRLFRSLVGDSLGGYVRGRRLTQAANLLATTQMSVVDVAFAVGFGSHEAFTRSFKSYFQQSPKSFRQTKVQIKLNEKPVLSEDLYTHLTEGMEREPKIVELPERYVVGFETRIPSPFTLDESYCDLLETPWRTLLEREHEIPNKITGTYYGLTLSESGDFTETELTYLSAVGVSSPQAVPEGMSTFAFPKQQVAIFDVFSVDVETVNKTMDYIYGYWLPNSNYKRGQGSDYEFFEGVFNFQELIEDETAFENNQLTSKYVIPICEK